MAKKYLDKSVLEAARERVAFLFDEFDHVMVSFSGGKDSGVALNIVYDYAAETDQLDKMVVVHHDFEAQYQQQIDYVAAMFDEMNDAVTKYWFCPPVEIVSSTNPSECWYPWRQEDRGRWVRDYPESEHATVVTEENQAELGFPIKPGTPIGPVGKAIGEWYAAKHGRTAVVVGIRADESLHRYNAVANRKHMYKGRNWCAAERKKVVTAYPIYDFTTDDVWTYYARTGHRYNKIYDLFYQAGMEPSAMRIASPFDLHGTETLDLHKALDPNMWAKITHRVDGANFVAIYGGTSAMARGSMILPDGYTWETYWAFLMTTLPDEQREHYEKIMADRKGKLADDELAVLYRDMCSCVLHNDYNCVKAGAGAVKEKVAKRKATAEKWLAAL